MKQVMALMVISLSLAFVTNAQCKQGNCQNGFGSYQFSNGDFYMGEWENGKRNGWGSYMWFDEGGELGSWVVCEWKDNVKHGIGYYTTKSNVFFFTKYHYGEYHGEVFRFDNYGYSSLQVYSYGNLISSKNYGKMVNECLELYRDRDDRFYWISDMIEEWNH